MTIVDEMAEQILRTCHSFVIYCRDFSSALCDREGNTVMQGSQDIAVHVGTLHLTAKAVVEAFGEDIHEGDLFAINDPYAGGTHFNDVRIIRPIFHDSELIAFSQSNGHWADIGGSVPGSFDVSAREHFGEGLRIPAVRIADRGQMREDVVGLLVSNTRVPSDARGDLHAQSEATRIAERELLRLCRQVRRRRPSSRRSARSRTTSSGSRAGGSPSCRTAPGRPRTTSTSTRPRARASCP